MPVIMLQFFIQRWGLDAPLEMSTSCIRRLMSSCLLLTLPQPPAQRSASPHIRRAMEHLEPASQNNTGIQLCRGTTELFAPMRCLP